MWMDLWSQFPVNKGNRSLGEKVQKCFLSLNPPHSITQIRSHCIMEVKCSSNVIILVHLRGNYIENSTWKLSDAVQRGRENLYETEREQGQKAFSKSLIPLLQVQFFTDSHTVRTLFWLASSRVENGNFTTQCTVSPNMTQVIYNDSDLNHTYTLLSAVESWVVSSCIVLYFGVVPVFLWTIRARTLASPNLRV